MIRVLSKACLSAMLAVPLAACGSNWQSALDVHGTSAISLKHLILADRCGLLHRLDAGDGRADLGFVAPAGRPADTHLRLAASGT